MHAYIVTGASRGLGLALAQALLETPCQVVGLARQAPATALDPERFHFIATDLSQPQSVSALMEQALQRLGNQALSSLSLINNAGVVTPMATAGHYPESAVIDAIQLNVTAVMLLCNAFLQQAPARASQLRILNISSGAAHSVYPGWGVYGASKAALEHFSRHLAAEQALLAQGARVCALAPGVIDTDMQSAIRNTDANQFPQKQRFDALKQQGKLSSSDAAARQILNYLHHADFGAEPVADIRTLTF